MFCVYNPWYVYNIVVVDVRDFLFTWRRQYKTSFVSKNTSEALVKPDDFQWLNII